MIDSFYIQSIVIVLILINYIVTFLEGKNNKTNKILFNSLYLMRIVSTLIHFIYYFFYNKNTAMHFYVIISIELVMCIYLGVLLYKTSRRVHK